MQLKEYSKRNFKMELQKKSKTASEVLEEPAVLSYEELGGLSGIDPLVPQESYPRAKRSLILGHEMGTSNHRSGRGTDGSTDMISRSSSFCSLLELNSSSP
jgi:hypothetical protein